MNSYFPFKCVLTSFIGALRALAHFIGRELQNTQEKYESIYDKLVLSILLTFNIDST